MQTNLWSDSKGRIVSVDDARDGAWVSLVNPTGDEIQALAARAGVDGADLSAALDPEERSRITAEDGYVLILVDVPTTEVRAGREGYVTIPLGIVVTPQLVVTVCAERASVLADFEQGNVRDVRTNLRTRFTLQLLMQVARAYLAALRVIDKLSDQQEVNLRRSTRNEELIAMLELEKSLVYLNTSLISNQRVLARLVRTPQLTKYEEDDDLLQDTIIENEQAMEMAGIYSGILSGLMDAYASVISNNQNVIMKTLAVATIVLSIPTMIFSAYGMNVTNDGMPWAHVIWGFPAVIGVSFALAGAAIFYMGKKRWF